MMTSPDHILPRLYIVRPGVVSMFTCTHPKHARCACHATPAQAQPQPQPTTAPKAATTTGNNNLIPKPGTLEAHFQAILLKIGDVLLRFPEAKDAVNDMLRQLRVPYTCPAQPAEAT